MTNITTRTARPLQRYTDTVLMHRYEAWLAEKMRADAKGVTVKVEEIEKKPDPHHVVARRERVAFALRHAETFGQVVWQDVKKKWPNVQKGTIQKMLQDMYQAGKLVRCEYNPGPDGRKRVVIYRRAENSPEMTQGEKPNDRMATD